MHAVVLSKYQTYTSPSKLASLLTNSLINGWDTFRWLVSVLFVLHLHLFCAGSAQATEPLPYLLAGEFEYISGRGNPDAKKGSVTHFVIAITDKRGLVGYTNHRSETSDARYETYRYTSDKQRNPIGFRIAVSGPESLLESKKGEPEYIALQAEDEPDDTTLLDRLDALELAVFSRVPLPLFLGSSYLGLPAPELAQLCASHPCSFGVKSPFGELKVKRTSDKLIEQIQFLQNAGDSLNARGPELLVGNANSPVLKDKMSSVRYECVFDPPLALPLSDQPRWKATCTYETKGKSGGIYQATNQVRIHTCLASRSEVDAQIDKLMAYVPNGKDVQCRSPIEYVWVNQQVIKKIDSEGLRVASSLQFGSDSFFSWTSLSAVLTILGVVVYLLRRSRS